MMPGPTDNTPVTEKTLRRDLLALGLAPGRTLVVHSSLSAMGWVEGGPATVIRALLHAVGGQGTLAMPAATPRCADPAGWLDPPVPEARLEEMRRNLPLFDLHTTPTTMGAIPEAFRTWPGTMRSDHPLESVCARGPLASEITAQHPRPFSEGTGTPFGKLYELDSWVLLLGVGFHRCTALHTAESMVENRRTTVCRFPMMEDGRRVWLEVPNVADDNGTHFPLIGESYLAQDQARQGKVGKASSTLFPMRDLVDFAGRYFETTL
jgi:aminoglycoside 3-N-acetyltransferase